MSERVVQLGKVLCLFDISMAWIFSFDRNAGVRVACGFIKNFPNESSTETDESSSVSTVSVSSVATSAGLNMQSTASLPNSTTSHGLNIQPTVSVLFLTAITALLMFFY